MNRVIRTICLVAAVVATPHALYARTSFEISIDTTALVGLGPISLDIQLTDGDPGRDSTAILSAFGFGGGAIAGSPTLIGGATGDTATGVTLSDSGGFLSAFTQRFTPGSTLTFILSLTTAGASTGIFPDTFSLALLDSSGAEIPTTGFFEEFLAIEFGSRVRVFASPSDLSRTTLDVPAPIVRRVVPEPSILALLACAAAFGIRRLRRS